MKNRWSRLNLKRGFYTLNRVVVPAMASETGNEDGFVTDRTVENYRRLSQSGAGIVFVEYSYVAKSGRSENNQLGIYSDDQISGLERVADVIKRNGAIPAMQIVHAGGKTSRDLTGGELIGPSAIAVPVKDREMETPLPATLEEIAELKESFLAGAGRAIAAGFQMVELHAAHGYGLNQWISPLTNQRNDIYGGSRENRLRILVEIVEMIRAEFPGVLISARIPGQDFIPGGLSPADMIANAKDLEAAGLDIINVSSGLGGWRRPGNRKDEGYLVSEAALIQAEVSLPVIGVGGIETGSYIDQMIGTGQIALAAVGRAILKDPVAWNASIMEKRYESHASRHQWRICPHAVS